MVALRSRVHIHPQIHSAALHEQIYIAVAVDVAGAEAIRIIGIAYSASRLAFNQRKSLLSEPEIVGCATHRTGEEILVNIVVGIEDQRRPTRAQATHSRLAVSARVVQRIVGSEQRVAGRKVGAIDVDMAVHVEIARANAHRINREFRARVGVLGEHAALIAKEAVPRDAGESLVGRNIEIAIAVAIKVLQQTLKARERIVDSKRGGNIGESAVAVVAIQTIAHEV